MKILYEWGKRMLRRIEIVGPEDVAKKPEIPQSSGAIKRMKDATDKAHNKRRGIFGWRKNRHHE